MITSTPYALSSGERATRFAECMMEDIVQDKSWSIQMNVMTLKTYTEQGGCDYETL